MAKSKVKNSKAGVASATALMLKAVADPDRLKILHSLREGPKNVGQLAKILRAEIVNVSHHLGVLRKRKIVKFEKKGRFVHYALNPDVYRAGVDGGETFDLGRCRLEIGK
jgi:DNA-binding transcriptional ArsR family regulator